MPDYCAITSCSYRRVKNGPRLFRLPAVITHHGPSTKDLTTRRRQAWLVKINRPDIEFNKKYIHVCADHFINNQPALLYDEESPDWIPTLKLTADENDFNPRVRRRRKPKATVNESQEEEIEEYSNDYHDEVDDDVDEYEEEESILVKRQRMMNNPLIPNNEHEEAAQILIEENIDETLNVVDNVVDYVVINNSNTEPDNNRVDLTQENYEEQEHDHEDEQEVEVEPAPVKIPIIKIANKKLLNHYDLLKRIEALEKTIKDKDKIIRDREHIIRLKDEIIRNFRQASSSDN